MTPNGFTGVEIETKKKVTVLKHWGHSEIPNFTLNVNDEGNVTHYKEQLREFIFDNNFESKDIISSLPQSQVFVRTIKVPVMNDKDLENFIKYESEQYIPLPLNEVTLGYDAMKLDLAEADKMSVLLVAAKKDIVRKYISIIKDAGLVPRALEPESLAMTRSLGGDAGASSAELIVDIGIQETLVVLSYKGFVILTRTVPMGDEMLIKALEQKLDLARPQATEYKNTYGLDINKVEGKVAKVLQPVLDSLIAEIKKSKIFFTTHNPDVRISRIVVSGQSALMPGLLLYMIKNFDVEVELANPWIKFGTETFNDISKKLQGQGPLYAVPIGLALKVSQ